MSPPPSYFTPPPTPEVPPQPSSIKLITTVAVPSGGQIGTRFVTLIYGLGEDNKMYIWAGDIKAWILA